MVWPLMSLVISLCLLFVIGIIVFVISLVGVVGVIAAVRVPILPLCTCYVHILYAYRISTRIRRPKDKTRAEI